MSRNLHGIEWDTGNYPSFYLAQIIQSVRLRNPVAIFYAKERKKNFVRVAWVLYYWSNFNWVSFDICELFYTKLSKPFKGQKHFQQSLCKRKSPFLFQLVNQWERNWLKWRHPCHRFQQFVSWLRGTGIWIFQFSKNKP